MSDLDWRKPVCGWCEHEADGREAQRAHAMVCPKSPLVVRVAALEAALRGLMDHACLCYRGTCVQCEAMRKLVEVP